jgi:hypothetical protein
VFYQRPAALRAQFGTCGLIERPFRHAVALGLLSSFKQNCMTQMLCPPGGMVPLQKMIFIQRRKF